MSSRKQSLFHELRAAFLPASLLAVFVGTALAFYRTGRWHWPLFLACVGGVGTIHAGANVLNDYCDHLGGSDAANTEFVRPFTGGSRLIQQGRLTPREVRAFGLVLLAVGVVIGLSLVWWCGIGVLAFLPNFKTTLRIAPPANATGSCDWVGNGPRASTRAF
jgi:1,4-dihydroxy-2-naphthoate octaprenyltransferase